MEFTLLFAAIAGVAPMWLLASRARGFPGLADRALGATIVGLFAGRLVAMIAVGINPIIAPGDILIVRGGVSTVGATAAALVYLAWTGRGRWDALAAAISIPALVGLAGWHAGCLFRSACRGAGSTWSGHPIELYAAGLLLVGAAVAHRLAARVRGLVVGGFALAWAAGVRLLTEPSRPSLTGGPKWAYAAGIIVGLAVALVAARRRAPAGPD